MGKTADLKLNFNLILIIYRMSKIEQKSVSIDADMGCSAAHIDNVINNNISDGWRVVHITSTGGLATNSYRHFPTLVIIFERTKEITSIT